MKRRKRNALWITYSLAAFALLTGLTIQSRQEAAYYKMHLDYACQRAFTDLNDAVVNIGDTLEKSLYVNTVTQQNNLAARLMRETSTAKSALGTLPLGDDSLDTVSKFMAQVGDFAMTLSNKVSAGESITEEEYASLQKLYAYAEKLRGSLSNLTLSEMNFFSPAFLENMQTTAEDFSDYPTLIYDGPFSDHLLQKEATGLKKEEETTQSNAQILAAEFLGIRRNQLEHAPDTGGNLPTYNFSGKDMWVSVSRCGGKVISFSANCSVGEEKLRYEDAAQIAKSFLQSNGINNMQESYYAINDGRCTINFAYSENDTICYSDLIKITVALDTGDILEYNASGYWMNHTERSIPKPTLSEKEAREKLSTKLTVEKGKLALIPTEGLREVLTWEFPCTSSNGKDYLIYINCETGFEEQIFILTHSDNGILVR